MKRKIMTAEKRNYIAPVVELIKLDNDISLQLTSDAPYGPGENQSKAPEYFNNDSFKTFSA